MITVNRGRPSRESLNINKVYKIERKLINELIEVVTQVFEVKMKNLLSPKRNRELVLARNMAYYILHTAYCQKAAQIAPHFKRDRTTILHGIHTFVNDIEVIPFYMEKYDAVMDQLFTPNNIYALQ
jgi:chromosomal replication initiation ATPase DnaA